MPYCIEPKKLLEGLRGLDEYTPEKPDIKNYELLRKALIEVINATNGKPNFDSLDIQALHMLREQYEDYSNPNLRKLEKSIQNTMIITECLKKAAPHTGGDDNAFF